MVCLIGGIGWLVRVGMRCFCCGLATRAQSGGGENETLFGGQSRHVWHGCVIAGERMLRNIENFRLML